MNILQTENLIFQEGRTLANANEYREDGWQSHNSKDDFYENDKMSENLEQRAKYLAYFMKTIRFTGRIQLALGISLTCGKQEVRGTRITKEFRHY